MKTVTLEELKSRLLVDPETKKAYDALEPEYLLARTLIQKRLDAGLSQSELAKKVGTRQSAISRLESGEGNPTFATLRKVAHALGAEAYMALR
ncbi:hypothetical protein A3C87_00425 [Candidatus Kaiserbacteria bacterium RIFCSPHIGHO2_02_FULL_49_34]|uniref:HTH cro/C1-type domain-containing protein n=1 Tax=Candidatus Kaiserbacteria bacterium RIFCSPHIGHO2_02_FULL_49_34 TaxID=1798491 RepID=A0A1F6DK88_9BACT|nr:MAG: hypothetical protein A3C87_00425 [Candidatus Kaiserbacteria bacterium RIFCSPHIGHO2_02_FULL_49_34]